MGGTANDDNRQDWFANPFEHLSAELRLLDLLIRRAVVTMRQAGTGVCASQAVYVSDDEVDRLLNRDAEVPTTELDPLDATAAGLREWIDRAVAQAQEHGVGLPLARLAARLGLSGFDMQAIVVCLAPELDRKYDKLYAYLQDDITRKRPSVDLVISLIVRSVHERWEALSRFSAPAPLRRSGILRVVEDHYSPSGSTALSQLLQVTPRFVAHLLGDTQLDGVLAGIGQRVTPMPGPCVADPDGTLEHRLTSLVRGHVSPDGSGLVIHIHGAYGAGQRELAHAVTARWGTALIELDVTAAPAPGPELDGVLEAALREGWLSGAPILLVGADQLLTDAQAQRRPLILNDALTRFPGLVFLSCERPWPGFGWWRGAVHEVELSPPDIHIRRAAWVAALSGSDLALEPDWLRELPAQFRLTPGQISDVVVEVKRCTDAPADSGHPTLADWYAACRRQSSRGLAGLAQKLAPVHQWDDLVLDERHREQLQEMCDQVRQREIVLGDWGLGRRIASASGLSTLFTGPPGTGKTMAAGVIANELRLDLYRIDLSQVVSKYIGETEKNLSRIFAEAEKSNAVLLFDEADALFGKRTQISDAHDRYANIETSYLLQRMEEYEGIAVLASNLRQNMDEAFLRRLRFVIEFPFPDAAHRLRIWESHLRTGAPLDDDLDVPLLAQRLAVSGGNIRNIVLAAAFLSAAQGRPIGMCHILRAARSEFEKVGKLWPELVFEPRFAGSGRSS
ncbi:MAG: ATP-binding protein [Pseudonocardiaceae bacterium]